jgi:two-component system, OmpR family, response regulator RegX3
METTTILVVEDDDAIARPLVEMLGRQGFAVDRASTGAEALDEFAHREVDLVLLDLMLPDMEGLDVCRQIRTTSDVPLIILTARGEEVDRVVGLEVGADDYVAKPFSIRELVARIRALLRRSQRPVARHTIRIGDVLLDPGARIATNEGRKLDLTAKEFDLLHYLMQHAGDVVRREDIMSDVWDAHWFGSTKTLDVHVSSLRKKLGDQPEASVYIRTVRGVGLRFSSADELDAREVS